jgi:alpha-glucosidase
MRGSFRIPAAIVAALAAVLIAAKPAPAPTSGLGSVTAVNRAPDAVEVSFTGGKARISQPNDGLLHLRVSRTAGWDPFPSFAVVPGPAETAPALTESPDSILLSTGALQVKISRAGGAIDIMDPDGRMLFAEPAGGGVFFDGATVGCKKMMPADEHYYGFGEKTGPLDKRGQLMVMRNTDQPHSTEADPLYQSHPFFIALRNGRAAGLFFDNTFKSVFDMGVADRSGYSFAAAGGDLNYWVIAGPTPKDVLDKYGRLVGRMPLPALWALGFHQCRASYRTEARVREIRDGLLSNRIPCDAIYLDIDYMDGYRGFTFDARRFPDPAGLAAELARDGLRLVVIVDPGVKIDPGYAVYDEAQAKNYFYHDQGGGAFEASVWPGPCNFPDFFQPQVRQWWGDLFKFYTDRGVAGIWLDMNEPAGNGQGLRLGSYDLPLRPPDWDRGRHGTAEALVPHARVRNVYALLEAEATSAGLLRLRPDSRPFVISRAGYAGIQRSALVWTGDNFSNWGSLRTSLPMLMNLGMSGLAFVGADIGGFGGAPSKELFARWIETGAFYPFARAHSASNMPDKEPWAFGPEVTAISREFIALRYRLLPYTYAAFEQASQKNWPVLRPLVLEYPDDPEVTGIDDEYLWGEWLLVAPVVENNRQSRSVYFPAGEWIDWYTHERVRGPIRREVPAPMGKLPLFIKAGAIIPQAPDMLHTGAKPWSPLTVEVFPGPVESEFTLYEDDGATRGYLQGQSARTRFSCRPAAAGLQLEIAGRDGAYNPGRKEIELRVFGPGPSALVSIQTADGRGIAAPQAIYDKAAAAWLIRLDYTGAARTVKIAGR